MIPIVMALDENYALPTCVTIHSILMNASCDTEYKFYLMVTDTLSDASKQKIKMVLEPYPRVQIEYLDMETLFDDAYIPNSSHVSRATYFRFMIPEMLATYDKCIYLDVDIVVCDDLTELYEINLADNYLAGVKSISPVVVDENMEYHKKLEIPSLDQFFNAGVLLMNLSAMRHADLTNELLHETNKENRDDEIFASQGILNKVCYNRILLLPLKFNVPIHKIKRPHTQELINQLFSPDEIEEAANNPIIVHYIGNSKPWNRLFDTFSYHWYKFALSSPFSEEIYRDATKIEQEKGKKAADKFEQSLQKNESLRQRNTQLEQKNESLRQRSTQLEQKNESLRQRSTQLEQKNESLRQRSTQLEQKNESLRQRNTQLEQKNESLRQRSTQLEQKNESLRQRSTQLEQKNESLRQRSTQLEQKNESLRQRSTQLEQKNESLRQRSTQLEQKNESLRQRNAQFEQKLDSIYNSASWKLTKPLRKIKMILGGFKK